MSGPFVLSSDVETQLVERKSRFITRLHRVESTEQAEELIRTARTDHPDARHHCTALVIGGTGQAAPVHRSNDDGEPSGTAGMPMLQALLHADLTDTLAVVIRYFGGIKLGAGGLLRAYTAGVEQAVDSARLMRRTQLAVAQLDVPIAEVGIAENAVRIWAAAHAGTVEPTEYSSRATQLTLLVEPELLADLEADVARWSSGRVGVRDAGRRTADVPLS